MKLNITFIRNYHSAEHVPHSHKCPNLGTGTEESESEATRMSRWVLCSGVKTSAAPQSW